MEVYLDNAATTPLAPEVLDEMMPFLTTHFGNPSSTHHYGRLVKSKIEMARKSIAKMLNCSPMEICFTSGGTEADNLAIYGAIHQLGVKHIISSPIEHHAVLHTVEHYKEKFGVEVSMVNLDQSGIVDQAHLKALLEAASEKTLVTLMHANNEIGTMINLSEIGEICNEHNALFHSDTVQTMGHFPFDLAKNNVHFITAAAHKFHGPKGVGFLYLNKSVHVEAMIHGGSQERNMRAGTENIYGIIGMAKALEMAYANMDAHRNHITDLKNYMIRQLRDRIDGLEVNGCVENSLYTVLNIRMPRTENADMLLFLLDIDGIACSGGSACSSGSNQGSHVLRALGTHPNTQSIRFSFSRYTTKEEIDFAVERLGYHTQPKNVLKVE